MPLLSDDGKRLSPVLMFLALPLLWFALQWIFVRVTTTSDVTERELWQLKGQVAVLTKTIDETSGRLLDTTTRLQEVAREQQLRGNRMTGLEVGAQSLGNDIKRETERLNTKIDKIDGVIADIYRVLMGPPDKPSGKR